MRKPLSRSRGARPEGGGWVVVIPFKGGPEAKSRLGRMPGSPAGPVLRRDLALAFLRDTVAAVAAVDAVERILLVSAEPGIADQLPGVQVVADPGRGLNAAVAAGAAAAWGAHNSVAVLTGDLPGLASTDLHGALRQAEGHRLTVVADRHGTGTTMITGGPGMEIVPRFGPGSFAAHVRAGHRPLQLARDSSLRMDIDTWCDLEAEAGRGVGFSTRRVLDAAQGPNLRALVPVHQSWPAAAPATFSAGGISIAY